MRDTVKPTLGLSNELTLRTRLVASLPWAWFTSPVMSQAPTASLRIFVLEDHPDTLKYFRMYLEDLGHTVVQATTMAEAIQTIPTAECDMLISDVGLPDGDGWNLLAKLQEAKLPYPAYAVAMSGFGMHADRNKSVQAGFRHHLLKPFDINTLDDILLQATAELKPDSGMEHAHA